uniref:Consortin isoform X2 n=1 Tax=Petromyzon marinus TaxID=7757 RepID=A0AAJ7TKZ4_PETMA|nr:consortin isoform X2 [Petromyzon marinus]
MEAQDKKNVESKIKSSKGTEGRLEQIKDIQPADDINQNDVQKSVLSVEAPVGTEGSGMAALEASQYQVDVKRRPDDLLNNNSSSTMRFPIDSVVLGFDAVEDDGSDGMKMEDEEEESGLASISASSHSLASICSSADVEALLAEAASECSPEAPASDATSCANGGTVAGGDGATTSVGPVAASADLSVAAVAGGQPRLDNKDLSSSGKAQRDDKVYGNVEAATHRGGEMEGRVSAQEDRGSALQCLLTGLRGVTQSAADKFALPQRVHQIAEVYAQKQEYDEAIRFIEAERLWLHRALQGLTTTLQCWKDARKELGEAAQRRGVGGAPGSSLPTLPEYEFEGLLAACRSHRQVHNAADTKQEETSGEALVGVVSLETATQSAATMASQVSDATKSISSPSSPPQLLDDSPPGSLQDAMERQAVTEPINGACKSLELDTEGISTTTEEQRVAVAQAAEGSTSGAHVNHGTAWDTELLDAQTSPKVQGPAEDQRPLESTVKSTDLGSALHAPGEVIVSRVAAGAGAASQKLLRDGSPPACLDVRCGEFGHVMRIPPPAYALQPEEADEAGEGPPEALATEPSCPSPAASGDGLVETACGRSESRGSRVDGATIDSLTEPMTGEEEDPERAEETKEEQEEDEEEEEEEESMEPKAMALCTLATNGMRLQEGDEMAELDEEAKRIKIEQWARPQNLTSILKKRGNEGSVKDGADRGRTGRRVRFSYPDNSAVEPDTEEGGASCLLLLLLMLGTVLVSVLGTAFYCYLFADSDVERTLGDSDAAATAQACADFRAQTKVYYGRAARCLSATAEALQHCLSAASGWLTSHLNATSV